VSSPLHPGPVADNSAIWGIGGGEKKEGEGREANRGYDRGLLISSLPPTTTASMEKGGEKEGGKERKNGLSRMNRKFCFGF